MNEAERAAADSRARSLLLAHLDPRQADTYITEGYFEIRVVPRSDLSKVRWYCLHRGTDSVIFELDQRGIYHEHQLCTHLSGFHSPHRYWPHDDVVLAHKLALENGVFIGGGMAQARCWRRQHQPPEIMGERFVDGRGWKNVDPPPEPRHFNLHAYYRQQEALRKTMKAGPVPEHEVVGLQAIFWQQEHGGMAAR